MGLVLAVVTLCLCGSLAISLGICSVILQPALESMHQLHAASVEMAGHSFGSMLLQPVLQQGLLAVTGRLQSWLPIAG